VISYRVNVFRTCKKEASFLLLLPTLVHIFVLSRLRVAPSGSRNMQRVNFADNIFTYNKSVVF